MTTSEYNIRGSTAVVTGSSSGIGRAIGERFAKNGINVVICSRSKEHVDPVADAINDGNYEGEALPIECDVTNYGAIEDLVETTTKTFGPIDILVNNAGASFRSPFEDISKNGWQTIVDINLHGAFNCSQVVGQQMRNGDGGTIINISSVAARDGAPEMAHYAAAKSGMNNFTRTVAYEWAKYGIHVNGIMPGLVATEGLKSQMGISAEDIDEEEVDRQIGTPAEIASVAQFLASPAARYILGQTIAVEGVPRIARTRHHEN
ncbi:SDR family NAD(P)-dependent oxidoreductase [Haladaptatus sp. DFWS20]|uniref:SDR family NAD(P)-dependent oxidoreductase n=1 Tax=Haladaptatus sp. DFWS20 TaxID=3403467 RepID=UPI003EBB09D5